jgi:drug/metabolite transporter (DMT)-like permease
MFGLGVVLAKFLSGEIDAALVAFLSLAFGGLLLTACLLFMGNPLFQNLSVLKRGDWINLLLLFGSALVVLKGTQGGIRESGGLGDLFILAGAIGLGFGFIPAKRLSERIETLQLTALRLLLGAVTLLPFVAFQLIVETHSLVWQPSLNTLWVLCLYILTSFCLGYLSQQAGFRLLKAWEMAAMMQTVPLFSTVLAILLLHDTLTPLQAIGGFLAVLGGGVVSLNDRKPMMREQKEEF